jgi:hypothetical protein
MIERDGAAVLARRHPLTVEGDEIGSFDLMVACGPNDESYEVNYFERRHGGEQIGLPAALDSVTLDAAGRESELKVVSSVRSKDADELVTHAVGSVPAALIDGFARFGNHSMMVETRSGRSVTGIRLGNTGARQSLPQLASGCATASGRRAELNRPKTGGLAAAK